jgi:hypothetical protein
VGSAALLDSVRTAFVQGMDTMQWACGGIALVSAVLAVIFLPRRPDGMTGAPRVGAADRGEDDAERAQLEV